MLEVRDGNMAESGIASISKRSRRRILLIEDHTILREGLRTLIHQEKDLMVCAEVDEAEAGLAAIATHRPDLVILDISLKKTSGLDLLPQIRAHHRDLPVLVLSMHSESFYIERALKHGANGYVVKQEGIGNLILAIRKVLRGEIYLARNLQEQFLVKLLNRKQPHPSARAPLTPREQEVLRLIGGGNSTRQIAAALHISAKTVESHRENLKDKLGLATAAELVHYAFMLIEKETSAPS